MKQVFKKGDKVIYGKDLGEIIGCCYKSHFEKEDSYNIRLSCGAYHTNVSHKVLRKFDFKVGDKVRFLGKKCNDLELASFGFEEINEIKSIEGKFLQIADKMNILRGFYAFRFEKVEENMEKSMEQKVEFKVGDKVKLVKERCGKLDLTNLILDKAYEVAKTTKVILGIYDESGKMRLIVQKCFKKVEENMEKSMEQNIKEKKFVVQVEKRSSADQLLVVDCFTEEEALKIAKKYVKLNQKAYIYELVPHKTISLQLHEEDHEEKNISKQEVKKKLGELLEETSENKNDPWYGHPWC